MDLIGAVARPAGEVKGQYQREGELKSPQILLIQIDFLWATKSERFVAVQLVWVRLRGSEGGASRV